MSLRYAPVLPCAPFRDSLIIDPQSGPGGCDATLTYNTTGAAGGTPYYHYIFHSSGGGSTQINPNGPLGVDTSHFYSGLCTSPYIVETKSYPNNNYFVNNKIFVDDPAIADSVWGVSSSSQIDTIYLSSLSNCGVNYSDTVDSVYVSNLYHIADDQFEVEVTILQYDFLSNIDTIISYALAFIDTSHQLCFDITFFCADSTEYIIDSLMIQKKQNQATELHSYIFFDANESGVVTNVNFEKLNQNMEISINPIPSNGLIILENLPIGEGEIEVLGIEGKIHHKTEFRSSFKSIDLSMLPNGVYIIR